MEAERVPEAEACPQHDAATVFLFRSLSLDDAAMPAHGADGGRSLPQPRLSFPSASLPSTLLAWSCVALWEHLSIFSTRRPVLSKRWEGHVGKKMQKPDGDHLPDIDDVQDAGASYTPSTAATSLSSAVGDNAPKLFVAAFVLLCFLCFGPRGIAMALIVLAALRITLGPVSSAASSFGSSMGAFSFT